MRGLARTSFRGAHDENSIAIVTKYICTRMIRRERQMFLLTISARFEETTLEEKHGYFFRFLTKCQNDNDLTRYLSNLRLTLTFLLVGDKKI